MNLGVLMNKKVEKICKKLSVTCKNPYICSESELMIRIVLVGSGVPSRVNCGILWHLWQHVETVQDARVKTVIWGYCIPLKFHMVPLVRPLRFLLENIRVQVPCQISGEYPKKAIGWKRNRVLHIYSLIEWLKLNQADSWHWYQFPIHHFAGAVLVSGSVGNFVIDTALCLAVSP